MKQLVSGEPPVKPDPPTVCIEDGASCTAPPPATRLRGDNGASGVDSDAPKVIISWSKGTSEDNITEFRVQILNGQGDFVRHPDCDEAYAATLDEPKCALSMESFWSGDFQMDQGTYITASIEAKNEKGWSSASRWNTSGAVVEKVPAMMNPPEGVRDEAGGNVGLEWNTMTSPRDGGSEITTYVLQFSNDPSASWSTLLGTDDGQNDAPQDQSEFTHVDAGNEKLFYKIAARNRWGTGPYSRPNLEIDVAQEPDQISSVQVNDAGMVRITWYAPLSTGGSLIQRYEVELKNGANAFVAPAEDCLTGTDDIKESEDSNDNIIYLCRIDMLKMDTEFELNYDESIIARVRAVNAAGLEGDWKESDGSAKVKTKPQKMAAAPYRGKSTDGDTLHVEWDKVETDEGQGGSEIIYYSVYRGSETTSIYQTSGTSFLYEQDAGDTTPGYAFRVAASNIYGTGEISELSDEIEFGSVPNKLVNLKSQNVDPSNNEQATIVWDDPLETIDSYDFQILDKNTNSYVDANSIMQDDTNFTDDLGRQFNCSELIDNFGYQSGDKITFRVRAFNDVGESEWSYPAIADMNAYSLSMLIL